MIWLTAKAFSGAVPMVAGGGGGSGVVIRSPYVVDESVIKPYEASAVSSEPSAALLLFAPETVSLVGAFDAPKKFNRPAAGAICTQPSLRTRNRSAGVELCTVKAMLEMES